MPELPEVETVRRGLAQQVLGATVTEVTVLRASCARRNADGAPALQRGLTGRTLAAAVRRGKYLWLTVDGRAEALLVHLGMSGQFRVNDRALAPHPHTRARLAMELPDRRQICLDFVDQRTFGSLTIVPLVATPDGGPGGLGSSAPLIPALAQHIARDMLDPVYWPGGVPSGAGAAGGGGVAGAGAVGIGDATSSGVSAAVGGMAAQELIGRIRSRHSAIKRVLLDQAVISGIGNIYADEALWLAKIHPESMADDLSEARVRRLLGAAGSVMAAALQVGGTSFDSLYINVNGESGYFSRSLNAYGRTGLPCQRCGAPITRAVVGGRSSHVCLRCQRKP